MAARGVAVPVTTLPAMTTLGKFPNGLATLMARRGDGPTALARAIKTSKQNVERWAAGARKLSPIYGHAIARHYDVPFAVVMLGDDAGVAAVPLISWVSAGLLAVADHVDEIDQAPMIGAADLPPGNWIALRVIGDSMDLISPPGSIILVDRADHRLVPNACYVIADEEGGSTYKRWRPDPERWEPVSLNKTHDTFYVSPDNAPRVVGRVRRTVLDL